MARKLCSLLAGLLMMVTLSACETAPPLDETAAAPSEYTLGSGDNIRVIVYGEESLSGEFTVDGSGQIAMPLIGEVKAAGSSPRGLEQAIAQRLSQGYVKDARVSVEVLNFRPFFIYGEIQTPGKYPYVSGMTALTAVAIAGGYSYRANQSYVLITRGNDPSKTARRAPVNTPVMPDDVVEVPERWF